MLRRLLTLLRQPYPLLDGPAAQLRRALLIGGFVWMFLAVFEPFGIGQWQTPHRALKLLGFGAITAVLTGLHFIGWPRLLPRAFAEDRWTVGRAMGFLLANVLLIAVANYLYLYGLLAERVSLTGLGWMVLVTFAVAVFPIAASIMGTYMSQLHRFQHDAAALTIGHPAAPPPPAADTPPTTLTLIADNEKDRITLPAADLLYLESSDNYCTVVYRTAAGGPPTRTLLRSSLSRLESQLPPDGRTVRCHRSFVVNLDQVERVTGNAQGYRLHLGGAADLQVPVARKYNDSLVAQLKGE